MGTVILLARTLPCLSLHQGGAAGPVPPCPFIAVAPTYPLVSSSSNGEAGDPALLWLPAPGRCTAQGEGGDAQPSGQGYARLFLGKSPHRRGISASPGAELPALLVGSSPGLWQGLPSRGKTARTSHSSLSNLPRFPSLLFTMAGFPQLILTAAGWAVTSTCGHEAQTPGWCWTGPWG